MGGSRIAVVIASLGRPDAVSDCLESLSVQTRPADRIILSVTAEADLPSAERLEGVEVIIGSKGSSIQRNRGIDAASADCDYVAFLDDDYVASKRLVEGIIAFMDAHPDVVGCTGNLLADGISGPGISADEARQMVEAYDRGEPAPATILADQEGLYGCNMAYRLSALEGVRFDENLPLYAWQEDIDFAENLRKSSGGRLVKTDAFAGVHRGVKSGRTNGLRLGYSQVANPVYLMRKGTMSRKFGYRLMMRNMLANHAKSFRPEPWVDRWGRVKGNWLALRDWLTGRIAPDRILDF